MKTLVVYYSNTGSNKFLAEKIAHTLKCEIEAIRPKISRFPFLLMTSFFNMSVGISSTKHRLESYDRTILCGPIWMGKFISPLRGFIKKNKSKINELFFVTCCGSRDETKNDKFGYATVFPEIEATYGRAVHCEAFPIALVLPKEIVEDGDAIMSTRLNDQNFKDKIQDRFNNFIDKLNDQKNQSLDRPLLT